MTILGIPPTPPAPTRDVYLPAIITGAPSPVAEFLRLLVSDPRQERSALSRCPALELAATQRAQGLANGDPWAHVDAAGVSANEYVRAKIGV